jgi:LmbE family N-acetylglucosaminyl deacetylase
MSKQTRRRSRTSAVGIKVLLPACLVVILAMVVGMGITAADLLLPAMSAQAATTTTTPGTCTGRAMQIVAHPDDDLLFMNPDIVGDVEDGLCVRTVYVTTGDAARDESYWRLREDGVRAAYATMSGAEDEWTASTTEIDGYSLVTQTLDAAPGISLVFMHLPDGNRRGTGNRIHDHESLMRLWQGDIDSIHAVDGSASYDLESLVGTLAGLIADFRPETIRVQDWTIPFHSGDNADHTAAALLAHEAAQGYLAEHTLLASAGYPSWTQGANVTGRDLGLKADAIIAYGAYDPKLCTDARCVDGLVAAIRATRQYVVATEVLGPPTKTLGSVGRE